MGEKTLALIKPDAMAAGHAGKIIDTVIDDGFRIIGLKQVRLTRERAAAFYAVHTGRPFYDKLVEYMSSGPIIALALDADDAIGRWRRLMGATDPARAAPGTIRRLFGISEPGAKLQKNAVHGSDSTANANVEIRFFFSPEELVR